MERMTLKFLSGDKNSGGCTFCEIQYSTVKIVCQARRKTAPHWFKCGAGQKDFRLEERQNLSDFAAGDLAERLQGVVFIAADDAGRNTGFNLIECP